MSDPRRLDAMCACGRTWGGHFGNNCPKVRNGKFAEVRPLKRVKLYQPTSQRPTERKHDRKMAQLCTCGHRRGRHGMGLKECNNFDKWFNPGGTPCDCKQFVQAYVSEVHPEREKPVAPVATQPSVTRPCVKQGCKRKTIIGDLCKKHRAGHKEFAAKLNGPAIVFDTEWKVGDFVARGSKGLMNKIRGEIVDIRESGMEIIWWQPTDNALRALAGERWPHFQLTGEDLVKISHLTKPE